MSAASALSLSALADLVAAETIAATTNQSNTANATLFAALALSSVSGFAAVRSVIMNAALTVSAVTGLTVSASLSLVAAAVLSAVSGLSLSDSLDMFMALSASAASGLSVMGSLDMAASFTGSATTTISDAAQDLVAAFQTISAQAALFNTGERVLDLAQTIAAISGLSLTRALDIAAAMDLLVMSEFFASASVGHGVDETFAAITSLAEQATSIIDSSMAAGSAAMFESDRATTTEVSANLMGRIAFHDEYIVATLSAATALANLGEIDTDVSITLSAKWKFTMRSQIRRVAEVRGFFKAKTHFEASS